MGRVRGGGGGGGGLADEVDSAWGWDSLVNAEAVGWLGWSVGWVGLGGRRDVAELWGEGWGLGRCEWLWFGCGWLWFALGFGLGLFGSAVFFVGSLDVL